MSQIVQPQEYAKSLKRKNDRFQPLTRELYSHKVKDLPAIILLLHIQNVQNSWPWATGGYFFKARLKIGDFTILTTKNDLYIIEVKAFWTPCICNVIYVIWRESWLQKNKEKSINVEEIFQIQKLKSIGKILQNEAFKVYAKRNSNF